MAGRGPGYPPHNLCEWAALTRARLQKEEMRKQSLVRISLISNWLMSDIRLEWMSCSAVGAEDDARISKFDVRDVQDIGGFRTVLSKSQYSHDTDWAGEERVRG
jgi:hypothetical protein